MGYQRDIMTIRVKLSQIILGIAPEVYGPFITYKNLKSVLYLELSKALYVILIAWLLFYKKLRKDMEAIGFKLNFYHPCVSNKMISDKQMTINWHVDDLKISHSEKGIIYSFIQWTKDTYEYITKINTSRVKIHAYISMPMDFTTSEEVKIYMK